MKQYFKSCKRYNLLLLILLQMDKHKEYTKINFVSLNYFNA